MIKGEFWLDKINKSMFNVEDHVSKTRNLITDLASLRMRYTR